MKVKIGDYYEMLDNHDWFFDFADDHQRWRAGLDQEEKLKEIALQSQAHDTLFRQFHKWKFNGEPFGSNPVAKPKKPQ